MISRYTTIEGGRFYSFELIDFDPLMIGDYKVPIESKVLVSQEKNISTTKINGMNGTIKEMSGMDDWRISIEYIYIPAIAKQTMVMKELQLLKKIWQVAGSLKVFNAKLNLLGIKKLVLTRFELPVTDRDFELNVRIDALSDADIDLEKMPESK
jgi:hypothetical protein